MGEIDRQRHQRVEFRRRRIRTSCLGRPLRQYQRPWRCAAIACASNLHLARVGREPILGSTVADLADGIADEFVDDGGREIGLAGNLAGDDARSVVTSSRKPTAARRVGGEAVVEDGVADLVATMSGWPIETDSLVNRYRSAFTDCPSHGGMKLGLARPGSSRHDYRKTRRFLQLNIHVLPVPCRASAFASALLAFALPLPLPLPDRKIGQRQGRGTGTGTGSR